MKKIFLFSILFAFLFITSIAIAEIPDIEALTPTEGSLEDIHDIPMYSGPTVQYSQLETVLDAALPYVFFGQSDSWCMVAQGTPDNFGSVGWIQSSILSLPLTPDLSFEDRLPAMVEDDTKLTTVPGDDDGLELLRGETISILARWNDALYVEWVDASAENAVPIRGFIPESAVE